MAEGAEGDGRTRLLIIEDDDAQLRTLSAIMEDEGFAVFGCRTASEAMEHLDQQRVEVVVTDLRLPDKGQAELMARLAEVAGDAPVIIHTGHASLQSAKQAVNLGAFAYVEKGRDPGELVQCVHKAATAHLKRHAQVLEQAVAERTRELQMANDSLRDGAEVAKALLNAPSEATAVVDTEGTILEASDAIARRFDKIPEEIIGACVWDLVPPEQAEARKPLYEEAIQTGRPVHWEDQRDGLWMENTVYPIPPVPGKATRLAILSLDITGRKRAEQSLQEAEVELKHTIEVVPGIIAKADAHTGYFTDCNPALSSVLGFSSEEFLARPFIEFVHPDDRQSTIDTVEEQLKGSPVARFENRYICKDGSYKWLEWRATAADEKGVVYAAATDITERKQAEDAQRLHSEIAANMPGGVHLVRAADGVIVYTNPKFEEIFGYGPGELIGKHISVVNAPTAKSPEQTASEIMDAIARNGSWQGEILNVRKDGTPCWSHASVSMFDHPEHGSVFVSVHTDITDRKQAEEGLLQAQKMEAVGQLAGGVAHDFRNQLMVIKWCADRLLEQSLVNDEGRAEVTEIVAAANRSAELTSQLLAFSRKEMLRPKVMDVAALILDLSKSLPAMVGEDIRLSVVPAPQPCHAYLDPGQFQQAVVNLVVNARDAMPTGGELVIEVNCADLDAGLAARHPEARPGQHVLVRVTDAGVGMDEETLAQAFDPFFTTKEVDEGTGLG
ncbi:hypothetical protein LCGC14_1470450, partial [marine sediment metagenome]